MGADRRGKTWRRGIQPCSPARCESPREYRSMRNSWQNSSESPVFDG
jgi:hypothetical protein